MRISPGLGGGNVEPMDSDVACDCACQRAFNEEHIDPKNFVSSLVKRLDRPSVEPGQPSAARARADAGVAPAARAAAQLGKGTALDKADAHSEWTSDFIRACMETTTMPFGDLKQSTS